MKPRLVRFFLLIVLLPLSIIAVLGLHVARSEREVVGHRVGLLLRGQLTDVRALVVQYISERERELLQWLTAADNTAAGWQQLADREPIVRRVFTLGPDGKPVYPTPEGLSPADKAFLERAAALWRSGRLPSPSGDSGHAATYGWYSWFHDNGLRLLFWTRDRGGQVVGVEVDDVRLVSDLVALLPDTTSSGRNGRVRLVNSSGATLYQWGRYQPAADEMPRAVEELSPPLRAWQLQYYLSAADYTALSRGSLSVPVFLGAGALAVALVGFAIYFYREQSREIRDAAQRVTFVNHVSHELKTPLTNIRMYAELLQAASGDDDPRHQRYCDVIVSESQRLSRLIGNVLAYARGRRGALEIAPGAAVIDDEIRRVLDLFRPSLAAAGVDVAFDGTATEQVRVDIDILDQIIGNLFSNVEKYAGGGALTVASEWTAGVSRITVTDNGPGIPPDQEEAVFQAFYRLSDKLSDAAGTGIGLSISRELARCHGGDIRLLPTARGASFEVTLRTELADTSDGAS
jgi:signal transduction histidine kinase